jgi:hypothetical protein
MITSKEKTFKVPFIISIIAILILFTYLLTTKSSSEKKSLINKTIFTGIWTIDSETDKFELNADSSTYKLYLHGSQLNLKGHWEIIDLNISNEMNSILVLKNEIPTTGNSAFPEQQYFKYYFYSIDKIVNGEIFITDLSAENTVRRNRQYKLKLK